ncbi:MAG: thiolase family protein [Dehalococcoidales bacterium]|nr:thiolase family protein [Dehalococcoidales bacterium]
MGTTEAWKKMREVCVLGVGLHKFGRFPDESIGDLGREAILAAFADAGCGPKDIQAAFGGRVFTPNTTAMRLVNEVFQTGILIDNVEKACATSSTAVRLATWAIGAGLYDVCLCVGVEKMERGLVGGVPAGAESRASYGQLMGLGIMPAEYALRARRHMYEYGSTREMFAQVAVKSHKNGALNPYAQYQTPVTLEEVLNARMIADPLTLYQCSPSTDGATAVVLCAREVAHKFTGRPITIAGWASGTPAYSASGVSGDVQEGYIERIAREAYERASVGPSDIQVAQVHDAFSAGEIFAIEDLGFAKPGEGGRFVWEGKADINGKVAINTDGGLESRGHPQGATGIAMLAEIVRQLRGEAGLRQVPGNPKVGLQHNVGVGGCNIFIYKK